MLPAAAKMFALVRDLSSRREVTEIPASRWLVQRHLLGPLTALAGVPALKDDLAVSTLRWITLSRTLPPLIAQLCDAGVGCAPIKGVAYAAGLYEVPGARPMTDVDLLVEPGRDSAAKAVFVRAGFACSSDVPMHHASTWVRGDLIVDLHRGILAPGRSRIALDEVWARTRYGWPEGARRLEPIDELVFHLAHMARNRLCGTLVQVVDAARLIERLPEGGLEAARERSRAWGIEAVVRIALDYCQAILAGTAPHSRLAPDDDDVLLVRQPRFSRKLRFDIATAGSPGQVVARAIGAGFQWIAHAARTKVPPT
jgi:hypothetical protein